MAYHNLFGTVGEKAASEYLEKQGYRILDRNWRSGHKEIDLVVSDGDNLIFVEVKSRKALSLQAPWEAVSPLKMKRIIAAADAYVRCRKTDLPVRFDILALSYQAGAWEIEHFEDAFRPGDIY